jgi:hypothetical protein
MEYKGTKIKNKKIGPDDEEIGPDDEEIDIYDPLHKEIIEEDYNPFAPKRKLIAFKQNASPIENPNAKKQKIEEPFKDYLKSYFFTKSIIDEYTSKISSQLTGKIILNLDDIYEYFKDLGATQYHIAINLIQGILTEDICSDISEPYIRGVLTRVIEQPHNNRKYDIAFIIDPTKPKDATCIISLVITQRSECFRFEDAYALNLICSRKCFSCGYILLGLYLYSILCHPKIINFRRQNFSPILLQDVPEIYYGPPILHLGILEISGGYKNISGLCLYTKFGFIINPKLSGPGSNCFMLDSNIAMIKRFRNESIVKNDDTIDNILQDSVDIDVEKEKIIQIVTKISPGYKKHIICEFTNKDVQLKLALLNNQLKNEEKEYSKIIQESRFLINKEGDGFKPEFKTRMEESEKNLKNVQDLIHLIESSSRDITLQELEITGGRKTKSKKTKKRKSKKTKTAKKRRNKSTKRH